MGRAAGALADAPGLDIIGLGALNIDLIATKPDDEVVVGETPTTLREILERLRAENLAPAAFLGGSSFNAMVILAQLRIDLRLGMAGIRAEPPAEMAESHADRLRSLRIIDPRGAGDAAAAGVLAALGQGRSVIDGCKLGLRIAALRVSDVGDRGHDDLARVLGNVWESSVNG